MAAAMSLLCTPLTPTSTPTADKDTNIYKLKRIYIFRYSYTIQQVTDETLSYYHNYMKLLQFWKQN